MATLIEIRGSVPQVPGARLLVRADGTHFGTIGGGAVEHFLVAELERRCANPQPAQRLAIDLTKDLGMCCGGSMVFFVENLLQPERLIIFGAGHVAKPTADMAKAAGFSVVVVDDREELNSEERFADCQRISAEPSEAAEIIATTPSDYLLVVTHDHRLDEEAIRTFCTRPHRYLGLIGSKRKVLKVKERVSARGHVIDEARFYAPVGVDVGAETPEEIAISIVAELIAVRHGQPTAHMRLAHSRVEGDR